MAGNVLDSEYQQPGALEEMKITLPSRQEQFELLANSIGNTPLDPIKELAETPPATIFQKKELTNPSGSHYDRVYLPTLEFLEKEGLILPGDELRDITSGSAGASLSYLGNTLGYNVRITVPNELPESRLQPIEASGATVVRCGAGYMKAASDFQRKEIHEMIKNGWQRSRSQDPEMRAVILEKDRQRVCYVNHSENLLSPQSFAAIGDEIIRDWKDAEPFAIALAMGNWTSIAGIASSIRQHWPRTRIVGYEGDNRNINDNYGTTVDGISFRFKDESLVDEQQVVSNQERDAMDARINQDPGSTFHLLKNQIGRSSLMGLVVAERLARMTDKPVICLAYDQKIRY